MISILSFKQLIHLVDAFFILFVTDRYHIWMQNEELLDKTASERLTLGQEYEMQQKWFHDEDSMLYFLRI